MRLRKPNDDVVNNDLTGETPVIRSSRTSAPRVRGVKSARVLPSETDADYRIGSWEKLAPVQKATGTIGVALLALGVVGVISPAALGLHLTPTHNLIHFIMGVIALGVGLGATARASRIVDYIFGSVTALMGVAGFAFGVSAIASVPAMAPDRFLWALSPGVFELGTNDHILHFVLAALFFSAVAMRKYRDLRR